MNAAESLPSGIITFLFTDIEGSTLMVQELGERWVNVLESQRRIMRACIAAHDGTEMGTEGDSFFVVFGSAVDAVEMVVEAQRALASASWPEGFPVRVRMGIHTGEAKIVDGGYVGFEVHRAARIAATGHGGQIVVSKPTSELIANALPPGTRLRELGEHRLKDLPRPEEILQLDVEGLEVEFPALKSLNIRRNNLPLQLSSFLGRDAELADLRALLTHERLVTLLGPGGMGKTRLAIQLGSDVLEEYSHGVWLVELAGVQDPGLVATTLLTVFGLREQPGRQPIETLVDYLHSRQVLLVLDNCEHLTEVTARLAAKLLEGCPALRIVATSREPLGLIGEATFRIPPLPIPDPYRLPPLEVVAQAAGVALFTERAKAANPSFQLTWQNAPVVVQLCRDLDGIPLAIELAAARMKILSLEQIAARLKDRFRLLTGGSRAALPRQQTLRAAIDWSFDLLGEAERALLRRLSIFMGDFSLEAMEEVCGAEPLDPYDVLDLATALVTKSLLGVTESELEPRYQLLETIRQYAAERLDAAGETTELRERHRDWFVRLAEESESRLHGPDQFTWFRRLDLEIENLRTAFNTCVAGGDAEAALAFASSLGLFWRVTGRFKEGRDWLQRALRTSHEKTALRAKALAWQGLLTSYQGGYAEAAGIQEESFVIYEELNDTWGMAFATQNLAAALHAQDDYETATALHERSLALFQETQDKPSIGLALTHLGFGALYRGDHHEATQRLEEALAVFREVDDKRQIGIALELMGEVELAQAHYTPASALLEESLGLIREARDKVDIAYGLRLLGIVARCQGSLERARELQEESLELARDFNINEFAGESLTELGLISLAQGNLEQAEAYLRDALPMFDPRERFGISRCLEGFASLSSSRNAFVASATLFGAASEMRDAIGSVLRPYENAEHEKYLAAVRAGLTDAEFEAAWRAGSQLAPEDAISYAVRGAPAAWDMSAPAVGAKPVAAAGRGP